MIRESFPRCYRIPFGSILRCYRIPFGSILRCYRIPIQVVKEQVVKEQVVGATTAVDNSLKTKEKTPKRGANAPRKRQTKNLPYRSRTENKRLTPYRGGTGKRTDNKTQPKNRIKTPDSLRQGASQAAGAAPTLRYGPAGGSAPRLRLRRLVWPKGSLPARSRLPIQRLLRVGVRWSTFQL